MSCLESSIPLVPQCVSTQVLYILRQKRDTSIPSVIGYWLPRQEVGCLISQGRLSQTESDFSRKEASVGPISQHSQHLETGTQTQWSWSPSIPPKLLPLKTSGLWIQDQKITSVFSKSSWKREYLQLNFP